MKSYPLALALCFSSVLALSCNNSGSSDNNGTDTGTTGMSGATDGTGTATGTGTGSDTANNAGTGNGGATTNMSSTPLSKADSTFVMKAAAGGMEEVEMGNLAQQNASSQRVKDFGAMMVRDHSKANDELKSFASGRGLTLPAALPADKQKDLDMMRKMTGKSFDQHYVNMMVQDHQKDVNEFKKQSTSGADQQLKDWAGKTLPVLQMHLDSIQAIKKSKM